MKKILPGLVAGVLLLVVVPEAALAAGVTVRVEGATQTLQSRTAVTTTTTPVFKQGNTTQSCPGDSAGGALELATGGDWGGYYDASFGQTVERIRTESYPFSAGGSYWSFWLNGRPASEGACSQPLAQGDEVLFFVDCFSSTPGACPASPLPLRLAAPATATRGRAFTVKVERLRVDGTAAAEGGATVEGAGVSVQTAGDGTAQVTPPAAGRLVLTATAAAGVRVTETVTVGEPGQPVVGPAGGGPAASDKSAPVTSLASLRRTYARGRGPRRLAGTVTDPSGVQVIKLRLTRKAGGRCSWYSGRQERFRGGRCGRAPWFAIGDDATWSYLLPERLGRGSYTLEAKAVDTAFNRDDRRPARVRFRVR